MSFRVKTTHQLLQTTKPPAKADEKDSILFFDRPVFSDNKGRKEVGQQPVANPSNGPKNGSSGGMAVRTVVIGQPDHM